MMLEIIIFVAVFLIACVYMANDTDHFEDY